MEISRSMKNKSTLSYEAYGKSQLRDKLSSICVRKEKKTTCNMFKDYSAKHLDFSKHSVKPNVTVRQQFLGGSPWNMGVYRQVIGLQARKIWHVPDRAEMAWSAIFLCQCLEKCRTKEPIKFCRTTFETSLSTNSLDSSKLSFVSFVKGGSVVVVNVLISTQLTLPNV